MPDNTSDSANIATTTHQRGWRWLTVTTAIVLLTLGWLGGSESGFAVICSALSQFTAGRLQVEAPGGRLLGDWQAQSIRWKDAALDVEIEQLKIQWSPAELLHGQLLVERIEATDLRIFPVASSAPPQLPGSLQLPLALEIRHLALGRVRLGQTSESASTLAESLSAALDSDGRTHHLKRLQAQLGKLALTADATLAGEKPFALSAHSALTGAALGQPFVMTLLATGALDQLQVDGEIVSGSITPPTKKPEKISGAAGALHARVMPFSAQPLASLRLNLNNIDPSVFATGAPQALLDVDAQLDSTGPSTAVGMLHLSNRLSGALDQQRLPLASLQTQINWQDEKLTLDKLALALSGGGSLKGRGNFSSGHLDLDLAAQGVDARALHGRLMPTKLAGSLKGRFGAKNHALEFDLRDALYTLRARASLSPEVIELAELQFATGDARLDARGQLALNGDERFAAQGSLHNFDPARFLRQKNNAPRSTINAGFEVKGGLRPALDLSLHFDLRDSHIGTQKLAGKGELDLQASQLRKVDIDLEAAGNRLTALGAFGKAGDTLRFKMLAPKLEALGLSGISGDANSDFIIGGSIASPEFSGELQSGRLHLASLLDLKGLSLSVLLGSGAQGVLAGVLRCTACALPAYGIPPLRLDVKAEGLRKQHHLSAIVGLPEKRELHLALDGGLQRESGNKPGNKPGNKLENKPESKPDFDAATFWNGTLSALRVGKVDPNAPPLLVLEAPAPLRIGNAATSFGPASIDGLVGKLHIERLQKVQEHWQSAGRLQQFRPQAVLADFPALSAWLDVFGRTNAQPLTLGGEWDFALGQKATGRAALWRESGDLHLDAVPLGLSEARLQASLSENRLALSTQLRGSRLGEINATLNALSALNAPSGTSNLLDKQAPWQGHLQARIPDLTWLGPLFSEGWQVAGQLNGELHLAGSAARPRLTGEWRGEQLALRALDQGMRLERGQALIEITPERLLLKRLSFESDFQPLPRALKLDENIDKVRLTGTPGHFEASGELALNGTNMGSAARLGLKLDRIGVMQRADQWIALSGDGELRIGERMLDVGGKLRVDAGFWSLAEAGRPSLSDDVIIRKTQPEGRTSPIRRALRLDIEAALGRSFHFRGAGVESRLAGQIRIRSDDAGLPRASGSIRTTEGRFDAYGQKLDIERGIINFQGAIDNPGLNILAVRKNLPVEAGVEVTGTAQRPLIHLVSTPNVPDTEKLSWLVLGRSPDQQGGSDGSLLIAAAQTIFGGQDGGVLSKLQQGLGIDEFGVSSGQIGGNSRLPTSRVASSTGFGSSQTVNGQIVSVGKRLASNALLSYEQSLNTTESIVKLTFNLNRQFSVVGRAGSESALDFFWNYSFGK